jgi:hypothetical protein
VSQAELSKALEHIRARAAGQISLEEILKEFDPREPNRKQSIEDDEANLPLKVKLAVSLREAGKLTEAEFFFHCGHPIVALHEKYWLEDRYDQELKATTAKMEQIEKKHGLKDDQYWLINDAPAEYRHESLRYDAILRGKKIEVFRRFAPSQLWNRLEDDEDGFWELYELGRRSVFEREDHLGSVLDLLELYESEAKKSASAKAYYAAVTMLSSAAEARILLECIRQPAKTRVALRRLSKKERPHSNDPLTWSLSHLISVAEVAKWLPNINDRSLIHVVTGWAHWLRGARNLLHPGRHILDKPHALLGDAEWLGAFSAYTALRHSIESARKANRTKPTWRKPGAAHVED